MVFDKFVIVDYINQTDDVPTKEGGEVGVRQASILLTLGIILNSLASFYFVGLSRNTPTFKRELIFETITQTPLTIGLGNYI
jgi:hypothetical protein